jgi:hypothetical protein
MRYQPIKWLIISLLAGILIAGCASRQASLPTDQSQVIRSGSSFGQTFTAVNSGLSGVSVFLAPVDDQSSGRLLFRLLDNSQATNDIARARLSISEITHQAYYNFDFPIQSDSTRKDYYLQVEVEDGGQVTILTAPPDSYLDGALYIDHMAQERQLGFSLVYDKKAYLLGLIDTVINWIPVLCAGVFLFILPGWGLFSLFWHRWNEIIWPSKLGLAAGLSLAIYPLLMLWTNLLGFQLGFWYAIIPPAIGLAAMLWKNRQIVKGFPIKIKQKGRNIIGSKRLSLDILLADISFTIVLALIVGSRLWMVRSLDVPLYGDSYQHSMISQLMVDHNGLFNSYQPYADLVTFTYHFGFHSAVAVYHWLSGVNVEQSMILTGQLVNIIAIISLYPMATKLTNNRWAGVVAILISGMISPMPNYYVNWGRYTQLAGQVMLPVVIWCAWSLFDRPRNENEKGSYFYRIVSWPSLNLDLGSLSVTWLILGGLALTHYRILILAVAFFPAIGIFMIFGKRFSHWLGKTLWIGVGGMLLFLPWFIHVFGGQILQVFTHQLATFPTNISISSDLAAINTTFKNYVPVALWVLALACLAVGIVRRNKELMIFTVWWVLIILVTNPNWLGLSGAGAITNFTIVIAFYIPISVLLGSSLDWLPKLAGKLNHENLGDLWSRIIQVIFPSLIALIICGMGIWRLSARIDDLDLSSYELVTQPDLRAMVWIKANTPTDSRFLVNSFSAYSGTVIVGSDAGWWLPLLAARGNSVPPLTYAAERTSPSDLSDRLISSYNTLKENGITSAKVWEMLKSQHISYIYIGQRQGRVNNSGPQLLDPQEIIKDSHFKLVYHEDRVWIFALLAG